MEERSVAFNVSIIEAETVMKVLLDELQILEASRPKTPEIDEAQKALGSFIEKFGSQFFEQGRNQCHKPDL